MKLTFEKLSIEHQARWDNFVAQQQGTIFHRCEWLALYSQAGFRNDSVLVFEEQSLIGILPLVSLKLGPVRKGYSLPLVPAGWLGQRDVWPELKTYLATQVDSVQASSYQAQLPSASPSRQISLDLTPPLEEIFAGLNKTLRSEIRKAQNSSLAVRTLQDNTRLNEVWSIYSKTMERQSSSGSYWRRLFQDLLQLPTESRNLLVADIDGKAVAFNFFLNYGGYSHYFASGADYSHPKTLATQLLLWENLLWAKTRGAKIANLGGGHSADGNDSLFSFKQKWGKPSPIYRSTFAVNCKGALANRVEFYLGDQWKRRLKSLVLAMQMPTTGNKSLKNKHAES